MPLEKLTILPENRRPHPGAVQSGTLYRQQESATGGGNDSRSRRAGGAVCARAKRKDHAWSCSSTPPTWAWSTPVTDVRTLTAQVYQLLKDRRQPARAAAGPVAWGTGGQLTSYGASISPWLLLESVSEEFSLFSPGGVPLRAKLNVSFREAWTIAQQLQVTPRHSSDRTTLHRVVRGETLSHIAYEQYRRPHAMAPDR